VGIIISYFGNGEGKTMAMIGRIIRTIGWTDDKWKLVQFMKTKNTGEYKYLNAVSDNSIDVVYIPLDYHNKIDDIRTKIVNILDDLVYEVRNCDIRRLFVDEIYTMNYLGLVKDNDLLSFMKKIKDEEVVSVLTGRLNASSIINKIIDLSNIVTEMKQIKYDNDYARKSIEY